jgi:hypothetical protein
MLADGQGKSVASTASHRERIEASAGKIEFIHRGSEASAPGPEEADIAVEGAAKR